MLLLARFVTGVAAAFMTPAGLSLITGNFPEGRQRTMALGVYAGTAAGGFSLGLVAGGLLASVGWRWVFFAPVISARADPAGRRTAGQGRRDAGRPVAGGFDLAGAFSITGAMLLLVYGVIRLEHPGNGSAGTLGAFAAGLALLAAFIGDRAAVGQPAGAAGHPALQRPWCGPTWGRCCSSAPSSASSSCVTLYLQELRGWSTLQTGLAMLVIGIDTVLAPTLTPRLVNRFGNVPVLFGGMLLAALAYAAVPARRAGLDLHRHAADPGPAGAGLRPGLRPVDDGRHRRRRRTRARPGRRPAVHRDPVRYGPRPVGGDRRQRRGARRRRLAGRPGWTRSGPPWSSRSSPRSSARSSPRSACGEAVRRPRRLPRPRSQPGADACGRAPS